MLGHRLQLSRVAVEVGNGAQQFGLAAAGGVERRGHFIEAVLRLPQAAGHAIAADHIVRIAQGPAEASRQSSEVLEQLPHAVLLDVAHLSQVLVPGRQHGVEQRLDGRYGNRRRGDWFGGGRPTRGARFQEHRSGNANGAARTDDPERAQGKTGEPGGDSNPEYGVGKHGTASRDRVEWSAR